jgi:hypothetical protein
MISLLLTLLVYLLIIGLIYLIAQAIASSMGATPQILNLIRITFLVIALIFIIAIVFGTEVPRFNIK